MAGVGRKGGGDEIWDIFALPLIRVIRYRHMLFHIYTKKDRARERERHRQTDRQRETDKEIEEERE